jgi:hypothetical protein
MNPFSPKARAYRTNAFLALVAPWIYFLIRFVMLEPQYGYFAGNKAAQDIVLYALVGMLALIIVWLVADFQWFIDYRTRWIEYTYHSNSSAKEPEWGIDPVSPAKSFLVGIAMCVGLELLSLLVKLIPR